MHTRFRPDAPDTFSAFAAVVAQAANEIHLPGLRLPSLASVVETNRSISVITCSRDEVGATRIRQHYEELLAGLRFEVIQITDARSLCEGYNRGFARSCGDVVIFSHDDIKIVSTEFPARLLEQLAHYDIVGVAGTSRLTLPGWFSSGWPHIHGVVAHRLPNGGIRCDCFGPWINAPAIQAIDGLFIAGTRDACAAIGFDEMTFDGFHFYDVDFSFRAYEARLRTAIAGDIFVVHDSYGSLDQVWNHYAVKFAQKFGDRVSAESNPDFRWPYATFASEAEAARFHARLYALLRSGAGIAQAKPRRNEPCPCGSGRKFKHCHGKMA